MTVRALPSKTWWGYLAALSWDQGSTSHHPMQTVGLLEAKQRHPRSGSAKPMLCHLTRQIHAQALLSVCPWGWFCFLPICSCNQVFIHVLVQPVPSGEALSSGLSSPVVHCTLLPHFLLLPSIRGLGDWASPTLTCVGRVRAPCQGHAGCA